MTEVSRIRKRIFGDAVRKTLPRNECAICTEAFNHGDELAALPCGHFFHNPCLAPWLQRAATCPTCRQKIPSLPPAEKPPEAASYSPRVAGGEIDIDAVLQQGRARLQRFIDGSRCRNQTRTPRNIPQSPVRRLRRSTLVLTTSSVSNSALKAPWVPQRTPKGPSARRPQSTAQGYRRPSQATPAQTEKSQHQPRPQTTVTTPIRAGVLQATRGFGEPYLNAVKSTSQIRERGATRTPRVRPWPVPVSYTHLTLPTKRIV
eukprot:TRINITY_DN8747_c0_g1_i2.p1 TRINITY_DN8747_c0_g1~~TRINITY_DN8747_c0_g1_i2.p1  ORF type:complete len:260 (-),score=6.95 TRINITY_DN8747_c0_g1_i2:70-849(-)